MADQIFKELGSAVINDEIHKVYVNLLSQTLLVSVLCFAIAVNLGFNGLRQCIIASIENQTRQLGRNPLMSQFRQHDKKQETK